MPSVATKADGRAARTRDAVANLLADGASHQAVNQAIAQLQSELAHVRRRRPADAALIDADLAGSLLSLASRLHNLKPIRPPGCPRVPGPAHLLHVFDASFARASDDGSTP